MRRLLAVAAFVLASSAAQAQYNFEYNGQTIRIDPDRGTVSIPGVYDNTPQKQKRPKQDAARKPVQPATPAETPAQSAPAPADGGTVPATTAATTPAAIPAAAPSASSPATLQAPATATVAPAPAAAPAKAAQPQPAAAAAPAPAAVTPASSPPAPAAAPQAPAARPAQTATATPAVAVAPPATAAPVRDPNSPVGVWLTEEKEGKVRIEACGANLCGYAVDAKSDQNREQILINMRPGDRKWSGRIFDPNTGSTYDSTIAMKGPDSLKVQGCAFGGMFCGGQTWTRIVN